MTTEQTGQEAVEALAEFLAATNLRPESLYALRTAAVAMATDGVGGALIIKVPRRTGAAVDVQFTTGQAQLTLEF